MKDGKLVIVDAKDAAKDDSKEYTAKDDQADDKDAKKEDK